MEDIKIFEALIEDSNDGMFALSLVDNPAVESDFFAFENQKKVIKFSIDDEEQQMVIGVVMRADFPIYRYNKQMGEFYIKYSKETIKIMSEKLMKDGFQNNINLMHNDNDYVDDVNIVQLFIKDTAKGINPKGFEDIEDGSLFAQYHINNKEVWESIKKGDFKGFSLEGYFSIKETFSNEEKDDEELIELVNQLKKKLKK